ncbi:MAG: RsmB/NOP family class I SAM-dependent RNA methyltransferase [Novosphingobium sp.]
MTPSARVEAAIEILDLVIASALNNGPAADKIIADWFRTRRFAGSSDRRAVRELAYGAIRHCGEIPLSGRSAMLCLAEGDAALPALFDGSPHAPLPIVPGEPVAAPGIAPTWLENMLRASDIDGEEATALLGRAPLDIRVNTLKAAPDDLELPVAGEATLACNGLRLPQGTPVEQWQAYREGLVEVQDLGSQLASEAVAAQPGETIIDLCAGAGGKTLALAAAMENRGRLIACDVDRNRLSRLVPRAERAGVSIAETLLLDPGREAAALSEWQGPNGTGADCVLVDAPCSGTGTWRRNPESRWRFSADQLSRVVFLQSRLIELAATLVRPGGRLVYVVCSLLDQEGAGQVNDFLELNDGAWQPDLLHLPGGRPRGSGIRLTPCHDGTDGFFVARLLRI